VLVYVHMLGVCLCVLVGWFSGGTIQAKLKMFKGHCIVSAITYLQNFHVNVSKLSFAVERLTFKEFFNHKFLGQPR